MIHVRITLLASLAILALAVAALAGSSGGGGGVGATTLDDAYNNGRTITVDAGAVQFDNRQTSGTGLLSNVGGAVTLAGAFIGADLNYNTNLTPGNNAITALRIATAATSRANTEGEGALVVDNNSTMARAFDVAFANVDTNAIVFRQEGGGSQSSPVPAVHFDGSAASVALAGSPIQVQITPTAGTNTDGKKGLRIVGTYSTASLQTASNPPAAVALDTTGGIALWVNQTGSGIPVRIDSANNAGEPLITMRPTGAVTRAGNGLIRAGWSAASTLTLPVVGAVFDLRTNITPSGNNVTGVIVVVPDGETSYGMTITGGGGEAADVGLGREAEGVARVTNGTTGTGALATRLQYTGRTGNATLAATDSWAFETNIGATGDVTLTLPSAPATGTSFTFARIATQRLWVDPGAADAIRRATGTLMSDGESIFLGSDGAVLELVADSAGNWFALTERGTLTEETP